MNEEILKELRDIHWPPPPSWWPLAWGYYVAIVAACLLIAFLVYFFLVIKKRMRVRKTILRELSEIEFSYRENGDVALLQASIAGLLRRILVYSSKDYNPASKLEDARQPLLKLFRDHKKLVNLVELLKKDRFHKSPNIDGSSLIKLVREQLKKCRI